MTASPILMHTTISLRANHGAMNEDAAKSVQDFVHPFRRAGDDGPVAAHTDGAVHDLGMFEEKSDECVGGVVVLDVSAQVIESARMQHFLGFHGQQIEKPAQVGFSDGVLDVFDDVELDASLAQDVQRAA